MRSCRRPERTDSGWAGRSARPRIWLDLSWRGMAGAVTPMSMGQVCAALLEYPRVWGPDLPLRRSGPITDVVQAFEVTVLRPQGRLVETGRREDHRVRERESVLYAQLGRRECQVCAQTNGLPLAHHGHYL